MIWLLKEIVIPSIKKATLNQFKVFKELYFAPPIEITKKNGKFNLYI